MKKNNRPSEVKTLALFLLTIGSIILLSVGGKFAGMLPSSNPLPALILSGDKCPDVTIEETGAATTNGVTEKAALEKAVEEATAKATSNCKAGDFRNIVCEPRKTCKRGSGNPLVGPANLDTKSCAGPGRPTEPTSTDYKCSVVVSVPCSVICVERLVPQQ